MSQARLLATSAARVLVVLYPAEAVLHDQGAVRMLVDALRAVVGLFR